MISEKFCVDCKFHSYQHKCNHPNLRSLVTGEIEPVSCSTLRSMPTFSSSSLSCGSEGKWFFHKDDDSFQ